MIRSSAKNSMKKSTAWRSDWPYIVCSIAWPVRSAAAQVRWIAASPNVAGHCRRKRVDRFCLRRCAKTARPSAQAHTRRQARCAPMYLDGVLITQPVRPLHGVVHVPLPFILAHVAERRGDATLRRHCVRAGREDLGDAGDLQPGLRRAQGSAQPRAAGADDDDIEGVVDPSVSRQDVRPFRSSRSARRK